MGEADGLHYLVMEYLGGETLDELLQHRGKLGVSEAVWVVYQALQGLQHLHEQDLVHRDLKPANLMVVPSWSTGETDNVMQAVIKILDMSLARALSDEASVPEKFGEPPLTTEGTLLGTPDYMAPEQARNAHAADIRADIYSLGCVLYHLLAGRVPFPEANLISQMISHAKDTPRPLKEFTPAVPDGLQQIVNWMMAKDPAQRYATPARAAQALQVFLVAGQESLSLTQIDPGLQMYLQWLDHKSASEITMLALPLLRRPSLPPRRLRPCQAGSPLPSRRPRRPSLRPHPVPGERGRKKGDGRRRTKGEKGAEERGQKKKDRKPRKERRRIVFRRQSFVVGSGNGG